MILVVAVADMSTDLYSVAMPSIAEYFQVHASLAQYTITFNLAGLAISGLVYGPLSDHYGRRPIMLLGMAIFTTASLLCCMVDNITLLILVRFMQGIGSGVAGVIGYAAIKDIYSGSEYTRVISKLNMVVALSPGVAPIIGSYIISSGYHWNNLFIIMSLAAFTTLALVYFKLEETLILDHKPLNAKGLAIKIIKQYTLMFKNRRFLGFATIQALTFTWLWAYVVNYPFIFKKMGIDVRYFGHLISVIVMFFIVGTIVNARYVSRVGVNKMLIIGLLLPLLSDGLLMYIYFIDKLSIVILQVLWIPGNIGLAFIISNNVTHALEAIKDTGLGSAFIFFADMMCGAVGTYFVGRFLDYGILPNLVLTILCSIVAIIIYIRLEKITLTT
uniref:multidrug effflux MFS transporter n=1 Tax=Wolbachia endosymbiont of Pentidionis agamae TaxID=3110435 RepID=UPI002FD2C875